VNVPVAVFSALYPSEAQPTAGVFIQERMTRVAAVLPVLVISPQPWFPGQGLVRRWRPAYRPGGARFEQQAGVDVFRPRFLALPLVGRSLDSLSMALCSFPLLRRLRRAGRVNLIDAHFAYPDGHAASLLAGWLRLPYTVTLRGTETRIGKTRFRGLLQRRALLAADRVIGVAKSLADWAQGQGVPAERLQVVGNGVDTATFRPISQAGARSALNLPLDAPVLISVGGLTERKGFHRVMEVLPELLIRWPALQYLVVGGASGEGDWGPRLKAQVKELGLEERVHFLGVIPPHELHRTLSAANAFVLATRNEGWANVFLEAMACGLPVVTTDVGGNREVVRDASLGSVVPFGDSAALAEAIDAALSRQWDHEGIRAYASANSWDDRVRLLVLLHQQVFGANKQAQSLTSSSAGR